MYLHSLCYRHTTVSFDISVKFYFTAVAPLVPGWYLVFFLFYIFKIPKRLTGIAVNLVECRLGNGDEQRLSCRFRSLDDVVNKLEFLQASSQLLPNLVVGA